MEEYYGRDYFVPGNTGTFKPTQTKRNHFQTSLPNEVKLKRNLNMMLKNTLFRNSEETHVSQPVFGVGEQLARG